MAGAVATTACVVFVWACTTYTSNSDDDAGIGSPSLDGSPSSCEAPLTKCGASCVDTSKASDNCGSCGNACASGQVCRDGKCELTCVDGFTACKAREPENVADASVDASGDASTDAAKDAAPLVEIDAGSFVPYCAKLTDDPANCGTCGNRCTTAQICTSGTCCSPGQDACGGVCTVLATDANNCGVCGKTCTGATPSCNKGVCIPRYTAAGVQLNVSISTATAGWTECFKEVYSASTSLSAIQATCNKGQIMMACKQTGSLALNVLAQAPRTDVFFNTGDGINATHDANGVSWYWSDNRSVGFAPAGAGVDRSSCDFIDSYGGSPQENVGQGEKRMCIHTGTGTTKSGFRCGKANFIAAGWERIFYHAD